MKKTIFFILILGLFLCLSTSAMADTDMVSLPTTTHTYTSSSSDDLNHPAAYSIDGNWSSYWGWSFGASYGQWMQADHTFATPSVITQIDFAGQAHAYEYGNDTGWILTEFYIQWYNGSVWAEVLPGYVQGSTNTVTHASDSRSQYRGDLNSTVGPASHTTVSGLNLVNCTKIRFYCFEGEHQNKNESANGYAYIYELQAWGNVDIGLRAYDGSSIVKIACEPAGTLTSPLRISKNGTTYAITLVDPTDPHASKIRVKTSSGIKALRKY